MTARDDYPLLPPTGVFLTQHDAMCNEIDQLRLRCSYGAKQINRLRAVEEDAIYRLDQDRQRVDRLREAARAFSELNTVYRTGGRPSEKLMKRLKDARITMQELGAR